MSFALDDETLAIVLNVARELQPSVAVEYGSGRSTPALAEHCTSLLSLEHDRRWLAATRQRLNGTTNVELRWARAGGGTYRTTLPELVDFALIDGPPIRRGRGGTLPQLWPHLVPGAFVFVDDLHHREVQRWVESWCLTLGAEIEHVTERLGLIVR